MGIVYKRHHPLLRRETALKLLPRKNRRRIHGAFRARVQLTCRLTHPNTIQVYDYGHTPDGIFYYAMEYLDGLNLHELVHRYGAQPEARVAHILKHICESLAEAHALGLIHRDVKPANIFITDRGGVPDNVKVLTSVWSNTSPVPRCGAADRSRWRRRHRRHAQLHRA